MNSQYDPADLIAAIDVHPKACAILLLLAVYGQPMTQALIGRKLGGSENTIRKTLKALEDKRLVVNAGFSRRADDPGYQWTLTTHAQQLALGQVFDLPEPSPTPTTGIPGIAHMSTDMSLLSTGTTKTSPGEDLHRERAQAARLNPHLSTTKTSRGEDLPGKTSRDEVLPSVDVVDLSFKDLKKIKLQQHQQHLSKTSRDEVLPPGHPPIENSPLYAKFFRALRAGQVWSSAAKACARALVAGEIALTLNDVLGIVVWGQQEGEHLGAFVRHHVDAGNVPDDQYRPPTEDFEYALAWVQASDAQREHMFITVCQACSIAIHECDGTGGPYGCPECGADTLIIPMPNAAHLPRWGDD